MNINARYLLCASTVYLVIPQNSKDNIELESLSFLEKRISKQFKSRFSIEFTLFVHCFLSLLQWYCWWPIITLTRQDISGFLYCLQTSKDYETGWMKYIMIVVFPVLRHTYQTGVV